MHIFKEYPEERYLKRSVWQEAAATAASAALKFTQALKCSLPDIFEYKKDHL